MQYGIDVIRGGTAVFFPCKSAENMEETFISMCQYWAREGGIVQEGTDLEAGVMIYIVPTTIRGAATVEERITIRKSVKDAVTQY